MNKRFMQKPRPARNFGKHIAALTMREGRATEEALFKIASDEIQSHAASLLQSMAQSDIRKRAKGHEVHLRVLQNGDIPFRMPLQE